MTTKLDLQMDVIKEKVNAFESKLREQFKDDNHVINDIDDAKNVSYVEDAEQQDTEMMEVNPNLDDLLDNHTLDSYDTLLNAELIAVRNS